MSFPSTNMRQVLKRILPPWALKLRHSYLSNKQKYLLKRDLQSYKDLSIAQVFTKVYENHAWGESASPDYQFFSGYGSHDPTIVAAYVNAVQEFLSSFPNKPNVVDLGCGDFFIGRQLRHLCDRYVACDIVEPVISFNKERFKHIGVDFRILDLTKDELPTGDIVILRQVLQHLSNSDILRALPQIGSKYKYLLLTEHLPSNTDFDHNIDKPAGPDIRHTVNSGVVLGSAPFSLHAETTCLCESADPVFGGTIRTDLYNLSLKTKSRR
jgi:hypothetical protein